MRRAESSSQIRYNSSTKQVVYDQNGNVLREHRMSEYRPVERSTSNNPSRILGGTSTSVINDRGSIVLSSQTPNQQQNYQMVQHSNT
jgi:hypothetical protein